MQIHKFKKKKKSKIQPQPDNCPQTLKVLSIWIPLAGIGDVTGRDIAGTFSSVAITTPASQVHHFDISSSFLFHNGTTEGRRQAWPLCTLASTECQQNTGQKWKPFAIQQGSATLLQVQYSDKQMMVSCTPLQEFLHAYDGLWCSPSFFLTKHDFIFLTSWLALPGHGLCPHTWGREKPWCCLQWLPSALKCWNIFNLISFIGSIQSQMLKPHLETE